MHNSRRYISRKARAVSVLHQGRQSRRQCPSPFSNSLLLEKIERQKSIAESALRFIFANTCSSDARWTRAATDPRMRCAVETKQIPAIEESELSYLFI